MKKGGHFAAMEQPAALAGDSKLLPSAAVMCPRALKHNGFRSTSSLQGGAADDPSALAARASQGAGPPKRRSVGGRNPVCFSGF